MKLLDRLFPPRKIVTQTFLEGFELGYKHGHKDATLKARTELTRLLAEACECDDEWTCQATDIERQLRTLLGKEIA